jgi:hypothetical protein
MKKRPFRRRLGHLAKIASLAATLSLFAAPLALAGMPEGVPPGYSGEENPGSEYTPEGVPSGQPEGVPPEGVPLGQPEGVPPEGVPSGQPEGVPPEVVPSGPPEGVPPGPPEGVPSGPPEGVPPSYSGTENPGVPHRHGADGAAGTRSLAREHCQEFKQNFGDNKSQFGRCIANLAMALHGSAAPARACSDMSRKPDENERRSDFSACVAAAAQALKEQ